MDPTRRYFIVYVYVKRGSIRGPVVIPSATERVLVEGAIRKVLKPEHMVQGLKL